jgi:Holliday junction resolvase-like predicted endonuclease
MQLQSIHNRESLVSSNQLQNNPYITPYKLLHSNNHPYSKNNTANSTLNSKTNYNNGVIAENIASNYLSSIQHTTLFNRVRTPLGELDIVAQHKNTLVFVEVKFSKHQNTAEFRISDNQKNRIVRSSEYIIQLIEHIKKKKYNSDRSINKNITSNCNDNSENPNNHSNENLNQNNIYIENHLNNSLKSMINKLDCSSIFNYKIDVIAISKKSPKSPFSNYIVNHMQNAIS